MLMEYDRPVIKLEVVKSLRKVLHDLIFYSFSSACIEKGGGYVIPIVFPLSLLIYLSRVIIFSSLIIHYIHLNVIFMPM